MHVVELRSVDVRAQSFYADLYLWLRFKTTGLDDERVKDIIERLEPVNGKFDSKDPTDDKVVGDERYVCFRVTGTFFFVPDLKNYPFDMQTLPITVENSTLDRDDLVFVDDTKSYEKSVAPKSRWGLSPTLAIPDYVFKQVERTVFDGNYPTNFGTPRRTRPARTTRASRSRRRSSANTGATPSRSSSPC